MSGVSGQESVWRQVGTREPETTEDPRPRSLAPACRFRGSATICRSSRILDAAANRAAEGLRVVEDYVRFVLDDRHLTELRKAPPRSVASARRFPA